METSARHPESAPPDLAALDLVDASPRDLASGPPAVDDGRRGPFGPASAGVDEPSGEPPAPDGPAAVDDGACAICLDAIPPSDVALVASCLHAFCAPCVVRWSDFQLETAAKRLSSAARSSDPTCPCCKSPFNSLLVYRTLDGEVRQDLREESLCLLRRARWLPETSKSFEWESDHALAVAAQAAAYAESGGSPFFEEDHFVYDEDYLDDEEEFMDGLYGTGRRGSRRGGSSASRGGNAIVIGNRRFGANGHISQGRRVYARPAVREEDTPPAAAKGARRKGKHPAGGSASTPKRPEGKGGDANAPAPAPAGGEKPKPTAGGKDAAVEPDAPGTPTDAIAVPAPPATGTAETPPTPSPGSGGTPGGAARGKKAAKRAEAKAKKEEKEALRRKKRAETMAAAIAEREARRAAGGGSPGGSLRSTLPDLSDIGDESEGEEEGDGGAGDDDAEAPPRASERPPDAAAGEDACVFALDDCA